MTFQLIMIIIGIVVAIGGVSYIVGRIQGKKLVEAGKVIGESEGNDPKREDVIEDSGDQVDKNEDVIKESEDAIKRAEDVLKEARKKVRKLREKTNSGDSNSSSDS